jgi:hypothetical protein
LTFQVGGKTLVYPKTAYLEKTSEMDQCRLLLTASDMDTSGSASNAFFGSEGSQNWLLGDQFMQNYYSVFDY